MGIFKAIKDAWNEAGGRPRAADNRSLEEKIATTNTYRWTKEEYNEWIDGLSEELRDQVLRSCRKIAAAGQDYMEYLYRVRLKIEKNERIQAENAKGGGMTIWDMVWAWDEARLMNAQREFYARENREARERRLKG